jgi:hypothetical protein
MGRFAPDPARCFRTRIFEHSSTFAAESLALLRRQRDPAGASAVPGERVGEWSRVRSSFIETLWVVEAGIKHLGLTLSGQKASAKH